MGNHIQEKIFIRGFDNRLFCALKIVCVRGRFHKSANHRMLFIYIYLFSWMRLHLVYQNRWWPKEFTNSGGKKCINTYPINEINVTPTNAINTEDSDNIATTWLYA